MDNVKWIQKILSLVLILIVPLFIIANFSILRSKRDLSCSFSTDFIPKDPYLTEKTFVFILYGMQDIESLEQTLTSILTQKYDSYRILLLENKSIQPHLFNLKQMAAKEGKEDRLIFLSSEGEESFIPTFRLAVESCKNDEVIVQLDPFDWLAHELVLHKLNQIYSSSDDIWLTYSQYLEYPSYKKGNTQPYLKKMLRNRNIQKTPWLFSHLKTYYAGLFKQIKLESPSLQQSENDLDSIMRPLVEKAKNHIRYIDDPLYIRNTRFSLTQPFAKN